MPLSVDREYLDTELHKKTSTLMTTAHTSSSTVLERDSIVKVAAEQRNVQRNQWRYDRTVSQAGDILEPACTAPLATRRVPGVSKHGTWHGKFVASH